jgi:type IV secretion system protein VirB4
VVFATQSLSDVHHSSIAPTIKEACFTKIYLPNAIALQPDATEFYKLFGLNDRQIEILAFSTPKQDYYYTSPKGNRLFNLALDSLALAYCSGASKERSALVRELQASSLDTSDFNLQFLHKLGLTQEAEELAQLCRRVKEAA